MACQLVEDSSKRHGLVHDLMQPLVSSRQPSMYRLTLLPAVQLAEAAQRCSMGATAWRWVSWAAMCVVHESKLTQIVYAGDHVSVESHVGQDQQSMTDVQIKA